MRSEPNLTAQNRADRTETGQRPDSDSRRQAKSRLPKDNVGYWKPRLRKRAWTTSKGKDRIIAEWQVRMFHAGREAWFNLDTANADAASVKARDIYQSLALHGWEATLARYKPEVERRDHVTVGEYLDAVKANSALRMVTFEVYAKKLRTLVAGVFNIKSDKSRFDYVNGGRADWLDRLHRIHLDRITDAKVETWKVRYLKAAEKRDPVAYERAKTTLNSVLRGARALFAPEIVSRVKLDLPDPLPVRGVSNVPVERKRYRSVIDPRALMVAAKSELEPTEPEQFKVLLLALGAGLRRREIDTLQWKHVNASKSLITVETSEYAAAKSDGSQADVCVDPGLLEILQSYKEPGCGLFVVRSDAAPKPQRTATYQYRCDRHFDGLIAWLRKKGVDGQNPIHTLRKEFGSQVCAQAGIFAASVALRHSDIQLTRDYYLDRKAGQAVLEVSKWLEAPAAVKP